MVMTLRNVLHGSGEGGMGVVREGWEWRGRDGSGEGGMGVVREEGSSEGGMGVVREGWEW